MASAGIVEIPNLVWSSQFWVLLLHPALRVEVRDETELMARGVHRRQVITWPVSETRVQQKTHPR